MATAIAFTDRYGPGLDLNSSSGFQLVMPGVAFERQPLEREWLSQAPYPGAVSTGEHEGIRQVNIHVRMTQQASQTAMRTLHQSLVAELRRPVNELRYLPHGATFPFFLDTFRGGWDSLTRGEDAPAAYYLLQDPRPMVLPISISPVIRGPGANLLSENQASVESSVLGWIEDGNCTVARSTTQALVGSASLRMTSVAPGAMTARLRNVIAGLGAIPVASSTQYTAVAGFKAGSTARTVKVGIWWYNAAGTFLTTHLSAGTSDASWTQEFVTATSPATARYAQIVPEVLATGAGELHYVDAIQLAMGTDTTWKPGGVGAAI